MVDNKLDKKVSQLSRRDEAENFVQGLIKSIPVVGGTLDQFYFGRLDKLRWKRLQATLTEIVEILERIEASYSLDNEDFANLLESVIPPLIRSTNEDKRQCLRDLLLNAAQIPAGDPAWDEAKLAANLLDQIDPPGLAILAVIARDEENRVISPRYQDWSYQWPVIEEWAFRLRELRVINFNSVDARGGFGGVHLTSLGQMLAK